MRKPFGLVCFLALTISLIACQSKQNTPSAAQPGAESTPPLVLTGQIPLEGVKGRFDHFGAFTAPILLTGFPPKAPPASGSSGYHVLKTIPVGGTQGWDYLTMDSAARRL